MRWLKHNHIMAPFRLMIEDYKKQGYTDQDLARMGFSSAIAPSVGLSEIAASSVDSN